MKNAAWNNLVDEVRRLERSENHVEREVPRVPTGWDDVDRVLGGGLFQSAVHEWFAIDPESKPLGRSPWCAPALVLIHLAGQIAAARGQAGWTLWIGRDVWPHGHALFSSSTALAQRSLLIDPATASDRCWAVDLAARNPAVHCIVVDGSRFDMADSRRLQLAAEAGHTTILVARPPGDRGIISAATTRWAITPAVRDAPAPCWCLELWRCKGSQRLAGMDRPHPWFVQAERSRALGLIVVSAESGHRSTAQNLPAASRPRKFA